ncbi:DNA-3-methyladenine glycosylase family protein [Oceanobacillus jeddahense]|uniref:DNA-3-methyladenine glycosylase II n=1 Tax=Oceanobacillus jeddahense TaxID=1462527 RepID=A0ABY5JQM8_9BACI|nr:DNA-3-methyladenine glycosylase [Oceanobacillus jeddahense]UUI01162.1 DNA-3-methyladenine glycosylase [Oceanobacillus jeddahense]
MITWKAKKHHIFIETPASFDFKVNLDYLQRNANECMYEIENNRITRVMKINHMRTLVRISEADRENIVVEFLADTEPILLEDKKAIVHDVCEWFDLERNLLPFYEMGWQDSLLKQAIERFYGLRVMGLNDLFEALCWGILGQQVSLPFAYTLKRQFVEKFGDSLDYNGKKYWIFPSFDKISRLTVEDLADIKMTKRKREYIIDVAKLMANGDLSKEKLLHLDDLKQAEEELVRIRGIGPWTANYVLMRCLRYQNAFPIDDVGLINAIKFVMGMDRKPTKEEIRALASQWENWESYATFYLWRMLY